MTRILLVQPAFPVPSKSLNHKDYLPVGLLKLAAWRRSLGDDVQLTMGTYRTDFLPEEVYVTSLFTYWSSYVRDAVRFYRQRFPKARIVVGGIYASLQPEHCLEYTGCDEVWTGVHPEAEMFEPEYSLVDTDFQIVHASRGCIRRCKFCGTYEIEPDFVPKRSVEREIVKNHLVFYDNNLLANEHISEILSEVRDARVNGRVVSCESQSGLDGRLLLDKPHLARDLKQARFRNPRIAWDGRFSQQESIREQLAILKDAGFSRKDTQVFILYNHDLPPRELMMKVEQCFVWGVQVADCRYRPLDLLDDGYNPRMKRQADTDYHVHRGWTDADVRGLRRTVRANNICVRYGIPRERYNQTLESLSHEERTAIATDMGFFGDRLTDEQLQTINDAWLAGRPQRARQ
jgi:hypothetical protein